MENSIIKKIEIDNFRSIHHQTIDFKEFNLFSGLNDSGKSNILKALNLFFNNETDFQTKLNFTEDFCKVELAKAQKASKSKQLIKVKVHFNHPKGYSTLQNEKELFVEKIFDRANFPTLKYSNESNSKVKTSISRILNKIQYIYIPSLKGEGVIKYLLGLIGEYKLIDQKDIEDLNEKVNLNTKDLTELLTKSQIVINTSFGLPVLLNDFWQKLTVGTLYENFDLLDKKFKGSPKAKLKKLNPAFYQIPLNFRGEGIKSKYIPPILQWLQLKNQNKIFIWGIDEPENSLEFRAAEGLNRLFCNEYAKTNQIFATSHSLAFLNPPDNVKHYPLIFRCIKDDSGTTNIKCLNDLFKESNKYELFEELGVLKVQKEIIDEWRKKESTFFNEIKNYKDTISELNDLVSRIPKPIIITEGKTDWKHLKSALNYFQSQNLFPNLDISFFEYDNIDMGDTELERTCEKYSLIPQPNKVIFIFDRDVPRHLESKGNGKRYKNWNNNVFSFCIPTPSHRRFYKNISIEFFYKDSDLKRIDTEGKRLFFSNEIEIKRIIKKNATTNQTSNEEMLLALSAPIKADEKLKKIYDQDASRIVDSDGNPVAISKTIFAENVYNKIQGFDTVDFSAFSLIFNIIEIICKK